MMDQCAEDDEWSCWDFDNGRREDNRDHPLRDKPDMWLLGSLNELRRWCRTTNCWILPWCLKHVAALWSAVLWEKHKNTRSRLAFLLRIMTVLMTSHTDYFLSSACAYTLRWCVRRCYIVCRWRPCHLSHILADVTQRLTEPHLWERNGCCDVCRWVFVRLWTALAVERSLWAVYCEHIC